MANRLCGREFYTWRTIGETGEDVVASDGLSVNAEYSIDDPDVLSDLDIVIVCGGRRISDSTTDALLRWLKTVDEFGLALGAVCTGSYVLAKAGLLDGCRCSVHWENIASMTTLFPSASVSRSVYTIDQNRYTCSGGTAPVDMMLQLVRRQLGAEISAGVAEQFVYERVRASGDHQRVPLRHTVGKQSAKLITAVELMEANIREPISQFELAAYVGLSGRQLQRLFQRYLVCSPSHHYRNIRLARARELLQQTTLGLAEIASQTGFASVSHFSKAYKGCFGYAPGGERRGLGNSLSGEHA